MYLVSVFRQAFTSFIFWRNFHSSDALFCYFWIMLEVEYVRGFVKKLNKISDFYPMCMCPIFLHVSQIATYVLHGVCCSSNRWIIIHIWNRCLDDTITLVWCAELYSIFYVNKFEFWLFDKMSSFDGFKEEDDVKTSGFHLKI